jgi:hypothetical protein
MQSEMTSVGDHEALTETLLNMWMTNTAPLFKL